MAANKLPVASDSDSTDTVANMCNGKAKKVRQKCSESRKIRKPLMEKKRRARINQSLNELKRILLEANGAPALNKEGNRPTKLEKADILELTVTFLQSMQLQLPSANLCLPISLAQGTAATGNVTSSSSDADLDGHEGQIKPEPERLSPVKSNSETLLSDHSSFADGFAKCTNIIETVLHQNLRPKQHQQIQRKLSTIFEQHLKEFHVPSSGVDIDHIDIKEEEEAECTKLEKQEFVSANDLIVANNGGSIISTFLIPTRLSNGTLVFAVKCNHNHNHGDELKKMKLKDSLLHDYSCENHSHLTENQIYHYHHHSASSPSSRIINDGDGDDQCAKLETIWRPW